MELLTGEFKVTLDEKGRISLPAHLRRVLNETNLTITQCNEDSCLWLYPASEYNVLLKKVQANTNPLSREDRDIKRRLFNSIPIEIDKAGRIPIIQSYREFAGLNKDCVVLGQGDYIEIWDAEKYEKYLSDSESNYVAASEKLGNAMKNDRRNDS
jgi:MraZ protein